MSSTFVLAPILAEILARYVAIVFSLSRSSAAISFSVRALATRRSGTRGHFSLTSSSSASPSRPGRPAPVLAIRRRETGRSTAGSAKVPQER